MAWIGFARRMKSALSTPPHSTACIVFTSKRPPANLHDAATEDGEHREVIARCDAGARCCIGCESLEATLLIQSSGSGTIEQPKNRIPTVGRKGFTDLL